MNLELAKTVLEKRRRVVECSRRLNYLNDASEVCGESKADILEVYSLKKEMKILNKELNKDELADTVVLGDPDFTDKDRFSLIALPNDYLIYLVDAIRNNLGYEDLFNAPEVYYDFYLNVNDLRDVSLNAICHHGEKDNYVTYEIPLTEDERITLLERAQEFLEWKEEDEEPYAIPNYMEQFDLLKEGDVEPEKVNRSIYLKNVEYFVKYIKKGDISFLDKINNLCGHGQIHDALYNLIAESPEMQSDILDYVMEHLDNYRLSLYDNLRDFEEWYDDATLRSLEIDYRDALYNCDEIFLEAIKCILFLYEE